MTVDDRETIVLEAVKQQPPKESLSPPGPVGPEIRTSWSPSFEEPNASTAQHPSSSTGSAPGGRL